MEDYILEIRKYVGDLRKAHIPKINGSLLRVAVREFVESSKTIEEMIRALAGNVASVQHNEGVAAFKDAALSNVAVYRPAILEELHH